MGEGDTMMEVVERIAKLEAQQEALERRHEEESRRQSHAIGELERFMQRFERYEAKWGGVIMVVTAIVAFLTLIKTEVLAWLRGRM